MYFLILQWYICIFLCMKLPSHSRQKLQISITEQSSSINSPPKLIIVRTFPKSACSQSVLDHCRCPKVCQHPLKSLTWTHSQLMKWTNALRIVEFHERDWEFQNSKQNKSGRNNAAVHYIVFTVSLAVATVPWPRACLALATNISAFSCLSHIYNLRNPAYGRAIISNLDLYYEPYSRKEMM